MTDWRQECENLSDEVERLTSKLGTVQEAYDAKGYAYDLLGEAMADMRKERDEALRRLDLCRRALQAMADDGWLLDGPEGPDGTQEFVAEVLLEVSAVERQEQDRSVLYGPQCPDCSPMHKHHKPGCRYITAEEGQGEK